MNSNVVLIPFLLTVHLYFKIHKQLAYKRSIRNQNLANFKDLNIDLAFVNWVEGVFNFENINDIYNNFTKNTHTY